MFSTNITNVVKLKHKVEVHIWDGIIGSSADTLPISWWGKKILKLNSLAIEWMKRFTKENLVTLDKNKESLWLLSPDPLPSIPTQFRVTTATISHQDSGYQHSLCPTERMIPDEDDRESRSEALFLKLAILIWRLYHRGDRTKTRVFTALAQFTHWGEIQCWERQAETRGYHLLGIRLVVQRFCLGERYL